MAPSKQRSHSCPTTLSTMVISIAHNPNQNAKSCPACRMMPTRWSMPTASCPSERSNPMRPPLFLPIHAFILKSFHFRATNAIIGVRDAAISFDTSPFTPASGHSPVMNAIFDVHKQAVSLDTSSGILVHRPSTARSRTMSSKLRWQDSSAPPSAHAKNCRLAAFGKHSRLSLRALSVQRRISLCAPFKQRSRRKLATTAMWVMRNRIPHVASCPDCGLRHMITTATRRPSERDDHKRPPVAL